MNRRKFMQAIAAVGTSSLIQISGAPNSRFRFIHFTDTHIQKELKADEALRSVLDRSPGRGRISVWLEGTWFLTFSKRTRAARNSSLICTAKR